MKARSLSDESYVLDLCDEVLGELAERQKRFDWLVGDPDRSGRRRRLPVDGFYPTLLLVIEYRERQHDHAVPFFDRRETLSGVRRGVQRRLYDDRRDREIPEHGFRLIVVRSTDLDSDSRGRLRKNRAADAISLRRILTR